MTPTHITITHLGAATCVTGSCHLIQVQPEHGLDDPKNDLFFVGYQAKGTPGRDIVEGRTPAKAAIHRLSGYSAHADQKTLCNWVKSMPEQPGEIRLVHGEPEAQKALRSELDTLF